LMARIRLGGGGPKAPKPPFPGTWQIYPYGPLELTPGEPKEKANG